MLLVMRQPRGLVQSVDLGGPFVPFRAGATIWFSPLGLVTVLLAGCLLAWLLYAARPLVDLRSWWSSARSADLLGAGLLAIALGGVILAFATADPEVQVFSPAGPWYLGVAAVAAVLFALHNRRAKAPLVPHGAFARRPAWGSLLVSFFVGAALIAALVDIPIFARITIAEGSQIKAALVLLEFLVALPVGALVGGALIRRVPAGVLTALGMLLAAIGFRLMAVWGPRRCTTCRPRRSWPPPGSVSASRWPRSTRRCWRAQPRAVHGVTSALLVVSRMVGMLVGISALTTIGLRRYYAVESDIPPISEVCPAGETQCAAYTRLIEQAGIEQLQAIFLGAAICAVIAAVSAVLCFGEVRPRGRRVTPDQARGSRLGSCP